jgi:hypothetical protein
MQAITRTEYSTFEEAYDYFNATLFDAALPACLITLQRRLNTNGYFSYQRFDHRRDAAALTDEIALNPNYFFGRTDQQIISTLTHEMVHQWQYYFGRPGRTRYHNREWAAAMEAIGLMPSHTGAPGGKRTGQSMSHYIVAGGRFDQAWQALEASGFCLNWQSPDAPAKRPDPSKTVYTCPHCHLRAWAKQAVFLLCGNCQTQMV